MEADDDDDEPEPQPDEAAATAPAAAAAAAPASASTAPLKPFTAASRSSCEPALEDCARRCWSLAGGAPVADALSDWAAEDEGLRSSRGVVAAGILSGAPESAANVPDVDGSTVQRPMDVLPFSVGQPFCVDDAMLPSDAVAFELPMLAGVGSSTLEKHSMLHSTSTAATAGPGDAVDADALAAVPVAAVVAVGDVGDDGRSLPAGGPGRGSLGLRCCWCGTGGAGSSGRSHCVDLVWWLT